jgi:hypothetical protein
LSSREPSSALTTNARARAAVTHVRVCAAKVLVINLQRQTGFGHLLYLRPKQIKPLSARARGMKRNRLCATSSKPALETSPNLETCAEVP